MNYRKNNLKNIQNNNFYPNLEMGKYMQSNAFHSKNRRIMEQPTIKYIPSYVSPEVYTKPKYINSQKNILQSSMKNLHVNNYSINPSNEKLINKGIYKIKSSNSPNDNDNIFVPQDEKIVFSNNLNRYNQNLMGKNTYQREVKIKKLAMRFVNDGIVL